MSFFGNDEKLRKDCLDFILCGERFCFFFDDLMLIVKLKLEEIKKSCEKS